MLAWAAQHHTVTLRLQCQQTCRFERTDSRDVESSDRVVKTTRQGGAPVEREVTVVTKVVEHVWDLALQCELQAFAGCNSDGKQCQAATQASNARGQAAGLGPDMAFAAD